MSVILLRRIDARPPPPYESHYERRLAAYFAAFWG
jgi:hypothetical protein